MLCRFVRAYQEVQPLTIGELWAVAITLADRARREPAAPRRADRAQSRRAAGGRRARRPSAGCRRTRAPNRCRRCSPAHERAPLPDAFAVQLVHRLRDQDPQITPALTWLDERLAAQGTTADAVVRDEHQRQGAANVTVRNIITSMRLISDVDWTELFERISLVDDVLAAGSAFRGRWISRRATSTAARSRSWRGARSAPSSRSRAAPSLAAKQRRRRRRRLDEAAGAIPAITSSPADGARSKRSIGFRAAAARVARAPEPGARHRRLCRRHRRRRGGPPRPAAARPRGDGLGGAMAGAARRVLGAIPAIDAAVALVNRGVTRGFGATLLPALELRDGVPAASAHAGRRADAADDAGGDRRADRASRDPLPREPGGRSAFRAALRLGRCRDRARRGRRRLCSRRRRTASLGSTDATVRRPAARASCCCIAGGSGTKARRGGSAGSASAASCTS